MQFDHLDMDQIVSLGADREGPCVSIYMPAQRGGPETRQGSIRQSNLVGHACEQLVQHGLKNEAVRRLLKPAAALADDAPFWQQQGDGLAVFIAPGVFQRYRQPAAFDERVILGRRFITRPLVPLVAANAHFYILALSQHGWRFFEATRDSVEDIGLKGAPESLADITQFEDPESQLQFYSSASGGAMPAFHGHGGIADASEEVLLGYLRAIDEAVVENIPARYQRTPLVLHGVEFLLSRYREVNSYRGLLDGQILGNPDELHEKEILEQAWPVVRPVIEAGQRAAVGRYGDLSGAERVARHIRDVLPAAHEGRISDLFMAAEAPDIRGGFDAGAHTARLEEAATPENDDLLDLAAILTLRNGGDVYVLPVEEMPGDPAGMTVAASLRY